ncbi:MAG TPA: helix-turn-helix domain-containing protein [Solirubrobacteraceae bacterium]|jgi:AcrR family transcriptional regulator
MAVRLTRAQSAARTRARLLAAAERVLFERGFHAASLEAVAEEAGLTKGAVYSQFESKADLFLAFQEERNEQTVGRTAEWFGALGPGDRPVDGVIDYWREKLLHDPAEYTLLVIEFWASACRDPEIQRRFSEQHERLLVTTGKPLEEAASRLGVVLPLPAVELLRLAAGIAHGLALERLMNPAKIDERMLEIAFAPLRELPGPGERKHPETGKFGGASIKGARNDGARGRSGRRRG